MTTFSIDNNPTRYKEILDSVLEQGRALKALHNPQTWRLSALTFAIRLNDCKNLFEGVRDRWKRQLPFSEAWDVNFTELKNEIWNLVYDINNYASNERFGEWQQLCDTDINDFIIKASDCLNGDVPITEVIAFLDSKGTELSSVILNMAEALSTILGEIDQIPLNASKKQFISYYDRLMKVYLSENASNPFPIKANDDILTFEQWIASKTEKQRSVSIPNKLNGIKSFMQNDVIWAEVWEENVLFEQKTIDKEGIGRAIFPLRRKIITGDKKKCSEALYDMFSSLALCTHLWEFEASQNFDAFEKLTDSRKDIVSRIEKLIDKGDWIAPATAEAMKNYIRLVLGVGDCKLFGEDKQLSNDLWGLLEKGTKDRVRIVFQNLIGYFMFYHLLPESKGPDKLNREFFGSNAKTYQNIAHGRPGNKNMSAEFQNILPLLDKYRPNK